MFEKKYFIIKTLLNNFNYFLLNQYFSQDFLVSKTLFIIILYSYQKKR